uniref:Uncharacterized protein n=1 Tax=Panagrolaimus davidi TaxID=227884 RepID=A0A914R2X4_9BILA
MDKANKSEDAAHKSEMEILAEKRMRKSKPRMPAQPLPSKESNLVLRPRSKPSTPKSKISIPAKRKSKTPIKNKEKVRMIRFEKRRPKAKIEQAVEVKLPSELRNASAYKSAGKTLTIKEKKKSIPENSTEQPLHSNKEPKLASTQPSPEGKPSPPKSNEESKPSAPEIKLKSKEKISAKIKQPKTPIINKEKGGMKSFEKIRQKTVEKISGKKKMDNKGEIEFIETEEDDCFRNEKSVE